MMSAYKLYYDESDWNVTPTSPNSTIVREPLKCIRIAILGDYAVGKTSLIRRLCDDEFDTVHKTTMGVDLYSTMIRIEKGARKIKLELYDTPGMDQYKGAVGQYCQSCQAAVIIYDISEQYSFQNIPIHMDTVRRSLPPFAEIFLIGAKSDSTNDRKVTFKDADIFATKHNLSLFETSSKSNSAGVIDAFRRVAELTVERLEIGTFDPETLTVPGLANGQQIGEKRGMCNCTMGKPAGWSMLCCWLRSL